MYVRVFVWKKQNKQVKFAQGRINIAVSVRKRRKKKKMVKRFFLPIFFILLRGGFVRVLCHLFFAPSRIVCVSVVCFSFCCSCPIVIFCLFFCFVVSRWVGLGWVVPVSSGGVVFWFLRLLMGFIVVLAAFLHHNYRPFIVSGL